MELLGRVAGRSALCVAVIVIAHHSTNAASICISREDCCSFSPPSDDLLSIPCCGSALTGPDALRCGSDGFCYRGDTPCRSSMDDPFCNIPTATSISVINGDGERLLDPLAAWRTCRHQSEKMQALRTPELYGCTALLEAVMQGRTEAVEWLLAEGADINARGNGGATSLHIAALLPQATSVVPLLLTRGAAVNAVDDFGFTPLHRFVQQENLEGATMLLYSGANLTLSAPGGETPLHLAAYENSRDLAHLLLAFGADPFARNERGASSFEVGLFDMSVPPHHMT